MDIAKLEELIMRGAENPSPKNLNDIFAALSTAEAEHIQKVNEPLKLFFENFDDEALEITHSNFFLSLALLPVEDSPKFRRLLAAAIKMMLPPYLDRSPVLKALGLRDNNVPTSHIVGRFRKLSVIKNGLILFLQNSGRWANISNIDNISGSVTIHPFGTGSSATATPLELVLVSGILLNTGLDVIKLADNSGKSKMTSSEFRTIVQNKSLLPVTEQHMTAMAKAGVAAKMSPEEFTAWWSSAVQPKAGNASGKRRSCDGRSLQEIILLLDGEDASAPIGEDEAAAFAGFFANLKMDVIHRETKRLAEVIVRISQRATDNQLKEMLGSLREKAFFWPADPMRGTHDELNVWSELSAKDIAQLAKVTAAVFHSDYLAGLAMKLPLKALNSVAPLAPVEELEAILEEQHSCSADLTLWIWKNRKKGSEPLLRYLIIDNIIRALSQENLPKAWTPSLRELRNLLIDDEAFQKFLITSSGDPLKLTAALAGALFLNSGERQSLVVKLSRFSKDLLSHIEGGAGLKILNAGMSEKDQQSNNQVEEPHFTSLQSHRKLMQELDDIIKIHKPENRESLKIARAHGDFRENSEFDAAKERRNFLSRRQGELERELMMIQPIDLRKVVVEDNAVIGSVVTLTGDDGSQDVYYLLGAWDGQPEKNYLSYKTRLGEVIYGRKVGESFEVPGGRKVKLTAVSSLPENILKDLD